MKFKEIIYHTFYKKEGIITRINKDLHLLWGTCGNAVVS